MMLIRSTHNHTLMMPASRKIAFDRIELIETFIAIVDSGNLSAAARLLNTTQPTISRRLQLLESYLGLNLIKRTTHTLSLTPDGERSYERYKALLATWHNVESDLMQAKEEPQGILRVLAPHAFGQEQLIGPLADYLAKYNQVSVEWNLHDDRAFHDFIGEGIDCAIQVGEITYPDMVAVPLGFIERIVIASPKCLANYPKVEKVTDLANFPWVALTTFYQTHISLAHSETNEEAVLRFLPKLRTDNLYAMKNAILSGMGIGVGSRWVMNDALDKGDLVHLLPDWQATPLPVHLVYPYAKFYPARLRCFVEAMKQVLPSVFEHAAKQA